MKKFKFKVELFALVIIFLSACTSKQADSFYTIRFEEIPSNSITVRNFPRVNFQETDSIYLNVTDDSAYLQNINKGSTISYSVNKLPIGPSRNVDFSVDSDSAMIVTEENKYYYSNHNESFYLLNLHSGTKKRFNWDGSPVTHVDLKLFKWSNKESKSNKEPTYHLINQSAFKHKLFRCDSVTYPLVFLYNYEWVNRPCSLIGIVKLGFNKSAKFYPALHPKWAFKPKDNYSYGTNLEQCMNAWLNDSIMLYSFASYNTMYQFNRYSTKFTQTQPHYQLFPDSICNNVKKLQPINVFDNTIYGKLLSNERGSGYLHVAYTSFGELMNFKSKDGSEGTVYLFWHKSNGEIYESALPSKFGSIVGAHGDTLLCSVRNINVYNPSTHLVKVVISKGERTTKTEYLKQLAKLRE